MSMDGLSPSSAASIPWLSLATPLFDAGRSPANYAPAADAQATTTRKATAQTTTVTTNATRSGRSFLRSIRTGLYVRMVLIEVSFSLRNLAHDAPVRCDGGHRSAKS